MLVRGERHVQVAGEFQVADVLGEEKEEGGPWGVSPTQTLLFGQRNSLRALINRFSFRFFFYVSFSSRQPSRPA